jgi:hypothetical protein
MNNNVTQAIGTFDKMHGISATVAGAIILLAQNFDTVAIAVSALATGISVYMLPSLISMTPAMLAATVATTRFTIALLANPLTWYAGLAAIAVVALMQYINTQNTAAQAAQTHSEALTTNANAIEVAKTSSQGFRDALRSQIEMQLAAASAALDEAGAQYQAAKATAVRADAFGGLMNTLAKSMGMPGRDVNYGSEIMQGAMDNINTAIGRVNDLKGQLGELDTVTKTYAPTVHAMTAATDASAAANDNAAKTTNVMTEAQSRLNEQYEFGKSTLGSFFSTFKSELMAGTSLWDSFGQAAVNVLDNIANKAMEMASNNIWDMIFGAIGGNFLGGSAGAAPLQLGFQKGIPGFVSGGYTGSGPTSGVAGAVHGQEFVMNAAATQRIGVGNLNAMNDNMPVDLGGSSGDTYVVNFNPQQNISGMGLTMEQAQELIRISNTQMLDELPDVINGIQADPRKRKVRAG